MTNRQIFIILLLFITSFIYLNAQDVETAETVNIEESFVIADDANTADQNSQTDNTDTQNSLVTFTVWDFLRMVLVLAFVAACIYGLVFLLKKASTGKFDESELIKIITSKTVSPGKTLHIVEIGNQMMILGISDDSITHIADIKDKETYEQIKLYKGGNEVPSGDSFYSYLSKVISPGKKKKKAGSINNLLEKQKKRMEKL